MTAGERALAALRERFSAEELRELAPRPYPETLREARARRAEVLEASRWEETHESARETPVIRSLHAFFVEREECAGSPQVIMEWDGGVDPWPS